MSDDLHQIFAAKPEKADPLPVLPNLPPHGIYFGMPEDEYHAAPALSASGTKNMLASPMTFWSETPWLNPDAEAPESEFMDLGKAYHVRITEGRDVFYSRYAEALDPADHPAALRTADEIRAAIDEINSGLPKAEQIKKSGTKGEMVSRLLQHQPDAIIWETLLADHAAKHEGKTLISGKQVARIEIAAAMIEKHPQLCKAFTGGFAEVSIFWIDAGTGVPMKARLDYLKVAAIVDLKTFNNQRKKPVEKAIAYAVAERKYHIQVAIYFEAIEAAKALIRELGMGVVYGDARPTEDWFRQWVAAPPPEFLFVFQQTGAAPLARGMVFPRRLTLDIGRITAHEMRRRFAECLRVYGTGPWLDIASIGTFEDTDFPAFIAD